jgi:hypothetical protein
MRLCEEDGADGGSGHAGENKEGAGVASAASIWEKAGCDLAASPQCGARCVQGSGKYAGAGRCCDARKVLRRNAGNGHD